jgi:hypothetical protein
LSADDAPSLRATIVVVLAAHFSELANTCDRFPACSPSDALTDLEVGEASMMDHIDAVLHRLSLHLGIEIVDQRPRERC